MYVSPNPESILMEASFFFLGVIELSWSKTLMSDWGVIFLLRNWGEAMLTWLGVVHPTEQEESLDLMPEMKQAMLGDSNEVGS